MCGFCLLQADVLPKGKEALQSYLAVNLQAGKLTLESAVEVMALGSGERAL